MRRREFLQSAAGAAVALVAVPAVLRADTPAPGAPARDPLGDISQEFSAVDCGPYGEHPPQACSCNLVTYYWRTDEEMTEGGYYSADRIIADGKLQPMDYRYHRFHMWLHRPENEARMRQQQCLAAKENNDGTMQAK